MSTSTGTPNRVSWIPNNSVSQARQKLFWNTATNYKYTSKCAGQFLFGYCKHYSNLRALTTVSLYNLFTEKSLSNTYSCVRSQVSQCSICGRQRATGIITVAVHQTGSIPTHHTRIVYICHRRYNLCNCKKVKVSRDRPRWPKGFGRLRLWIFSTFGTMKVVRSSPIRTGRLYPQEYPSTHF
jgi:hypothetical protein